MLDLVTAHFFPSFSVKKVVKLSLTSKLLTASNPLSCLKHPQRATSVFDLVQCKKGKHNMFFLGFLPSNKATDLKQTTKNTQYIFFSSISPMKSISEVVEKFNFTLFTFVWPPNVFHHRSNYMNFMTRRLLDLQTPWPWMFTKPRMCWLSPIMVIDLQPTVLMTVQDKATRIRHHPYRI